MSGLTSKPHAELWPPASPVRGCSHCQTTRRMRALSVALLRVSDWWCESPQAGVSWTARTGACSRTDVDVGQASTGQTLFASVSSPAALVALVALHRCIAASCRHRRVCIASPKSNRCDVTWPCPGLNLDGNCFPKSGFFILIGVSARAQLVEAIGEWLQKRGVKGWPG